MIDFVINDIFEMLEYDIVSHGWILQIMSEHEVPRDEWKDVLSRILFHEIEIGHTRLNSPDHLEFIGWVGSIKSRIERASALLESTNERDREFAYWLARRNNVAEYEAVEPA